MPFLLLPEGEIEDVFGGHKSSLIRYNKVCAVGSFPFFEIGQGRWERKKIARVGHWGKKANMIEKGVIAN